MDSTRIILMENKRGNFYDYGFSWTFFMVDELLKKMTLVDKGDF